MDCGTIIRDVEIKELVFEGAGFARLDNGAAVFVPYSAVGDVLTIEVTAVHKNFYNAVIRKIQQPGEGRCEPACPFFGRCGGCSYQHIDYAHEVQAKRAQFATIMRRIGHFEEFPELELFYEAPKRFGYRNKLKLEPLAEKGRFSKRPYLDYGFCGLDNREFFAVPKCLLAMDAINDTIRGAARGEWGAQNAKRREPYPLTLRADSNGNCAFFFGFASSRLPWLHERLLDKEVLVPVGSFWQVNPEVASALLEHVRGWLEPIGARTFVDAYAGVGTFSLALGDLFRNRVIIESDAQAVNASRKNHEMLGLQASFVSGKTEEALGQVLSKTDSRDTVVLLDPPRTGCHPHVLKALQEFKPETIVYVSCNPTTLARDLEKLCADGAYKPLRCAVFDMFPATAHFESAVLLKKTKKRPISNNNPS